MVEKTSLIETQAIDNENQIEYFVFCSFFWIFLTDRCLNDSMVYSV